MKCSYFDNDSKHELASHLMKQQNGALCTSTLLNCSENIKVWCLASNSELMQLCSCVNWCSSSPEKASNTHTHTSFIPIACNFPSQAFNSTVQMRLQFAIKLTIGNSCWQLTLPGTRSQSGKMKHLNAYLKFAQQEDKLFQPLHKLPCRNGYQARSWFSLLEVIQRSRSCFAYILLSSTYGRFEWS